MSFRSYVILYWLGEEENLTSFLSGPTFRKTERAS